MNLLSIGPALPKTLSALAAPTGRCTPVEKVVVDCLTSCERLAGRVATISDAWAAVIGSDLFLAAFTVQHSLARVNRNRSCDCRS